MESEFNPFEIRRSRDIRNRLGSAMIQSIRQESPEPILLARTALGIREDEPKARAYAENLINHCEAVLENIRKKGILSGDLYRIADLLWREDLFFEYHEWLEQNWQSVQGLEKEILQALIRSAVAFELLAYGRRKGAVQSASKALPVLTRNQNNLPDGMDLQLQINGLETLLKENRNRA